MTTSPNAADGGKEEVTTAGASSLFSLLDSPFAALLDDEAQLDSASAALREMAEQAGGVASSTALPLSLDRRRQAAPSLSALLRQAVDAAAAGKGSAADPPSEETQPRPAADDGSGRSGLSVSATSPAAAALVSNCIRAVGNLCIDDDDVRGLFLSHGALPSLILCLRRFPQVAVPKVAIAALANLVCGHEQAQQAFVDQHPTPVITALLNRTINRLREGAGSEDDYVLCKLILRLYINVAAYSSLTPHSVVVHRHHQLLSSQLIPSCISLGRLFVIPITDQPDPDDHSLLADLLTLFTAFYPSLIDSSSHFALISFVIDIAKRNNPALHSLALPLLASWWRAHPDRILSFLSSRLHSSKPALQLSALTTLVGLASTADDTSVVEAVLKALPLVAGMLSSKEEDVATMALRLVGQVVRHQEVREEVWDTKGMREGLWKAVQHGRGAEVMGVLSVLALSVSLHAKMEAAGVVEKVVEWMLQQGQDGSGVQELRGGWRVLHHLLAVLVERDGGNEKLDNQRWEWKELRAREPNAVPSPLRSTHRSIASRLVQSQPFIALLLSPAPVDTADALLLDRAQMLAALLGAGTGADESLNSSPAVEPLLVALSHSPLFAHQQAAATAWQVLLRSSQAVNSGGQLPALPQLKPSALHLLDSGSALVVTDAVECVELLPLSEEEVERVRAVAQRWQPMAAAVSPMDPDERMESDTIVLLLHQRLVSLAAGTSSHAGP